MRVEPLWLVACRLVDLWGSCGHNHNCLFVCVFCVSLEIGGKFEENPGGKP